MLEPQVSLVCCHDQFRPSSSIRRSPLSPVTQALLTRTFCRRQKASKKAINKTIFVIYRSTAANQSRVNLTCFLVKSCMLVSSFSGIFCATRWQATAMQDARKACGELRLDSLSVEACTPD